MLKAREELDVVMDGVVIPPVKVDAPPTPSVPESVWLPVTVMLEKDWLAELEQPVPAHVILPLVSTAKIGEPFHVNCHFCGEPVLLESWKPVEAVLKEIGLLSPRMTAGAPLEIGRA